MEPMQQNNKFERERRHLTRWAWGVTVAYAVVLLMFATFVLFGEKGVNSFREMSPNEVGDLFAGIAGPLAFIWLVYGYLLQGISMRQHAKEIAQSAMALSMQAVQMEEQKKRRAIAISPNFQLRSLGGDPISETMHEARFEIENINEGARNIQIDFEGNRYPAGMGSARSAIIFALPCTRCHARSV